jgi:predicted nucleic acid-binding protein
MILVDTSVWIDHFRKSNGKLMHLLEFDLVAVHPFVIGELACGNLKNRTEILNLLDDLPQTEKAFDNEVRDMVEQHKLYGRGIGWVAAHLLASCLLCGAGLFTLDQRLEKTAAELL